VRDPKEYCLPPMSFRPPHPPKNIVDRFHAEFLCVYRIPCLFSVVLEFLMSGLKDHFQEFLVSMHAADIFRWATPLTANADWLGGGIRG
jgi:hypothetical protein